ncbi:MAG TPA: hypothetical protein VKD21_04400 [Acidimicrobiales bacterium]|nr:hypothetical protein [Acidimicrobiales bacterium]
MIAALFVEPGGVYYGLEHVEPWGPAEDARLYAGPWPVVAHPPCARWGRYWFGGPSSKTRKAKGDDGGCFAAALAAVRRWGGVLEHPEASHAWPLFNLNDPPKDGHWVAADWEGGWTCCVEQGHYGHRARKATWLYAHGVELPELVWGPAASRIRLEDGYHSREERRRKTAERGGSGARERLSHRELAATPIPFRDLLLSMAATARREEAA